jgi:hypothetical protein
MESAKGATLRVQLALKEQEKVSQRTGKQVSVIYIYGNIVLLSLIHVDPLHIYFEHMD